MIVANKRYSYPRVAAIRIDVHPVGENPTNTPHAFHTQSVYGSRSYVSHVINAYQPFVSHRQSWTESLLPRKMAPDTGHSTPADRSVGPYPVSLLSQPMKQWREPNICRQQATRLIGSISLACDQYVQYLLTGSTHRSLIDTGGGYSHKDVGFPHTTPRPSQPMVSPFHLRVPPGLQFNQLLPSKPKFEFKESYGRYVVFQPPDYLPCPTSMPSHS
jgi:hypothetical protein